jgi:hypothetical protein
MWVPVPFHVGTDYAIWAATTLDRNLLPTSIGIRNWPGNRALRSPGCGAPAVAAALRYWRKRSGDHDGGSRRSGGNRTHRMLSAGAEGHARESIGGSKV